LNQGRVTSFNIEYEMYEALRRMAQSEGKSVSQLIREIILEFLARRGVEVKASAQAPDPPQDPGTDPVLKLDIEDLSEDLNSIESALSNVESVLSRLQNPTPVQAEGFLRFYGHKLAETLSSVESKLRKIRSKYYRLKSRAGRSEDLHSIAERIYQLNRKLKSLNERLEELRKIVKR
jgi:vacuolar-type H+-ATPase subunit I/STV1